MSGLSPGLRARIESGQALEYVVYGKIMGKDIVQWEADDPDKACIVLCGPEAVDELVRDYPGIKRARMVPEVVFDLALKMIKGEDAEPLTVEWGGNPVLIGDNGLVIALTINEGQP